MTKIGIVLEGVNYIMVVDETLSWQILEADGVELNIMHSLFYTSILKGNPIAKLKIDEQIEFALEEK